MISRRAGRSSGCPGEQSNIDFSSSRFIFLTWLCIRDPIICRKASSSFPLLLLSVPPLFLCSIDLLLEDQTSSEKTTRFPTFISLQVESPDLLPFWVYENLRFFCGYGGFLFGRLIVWSNGYNKKRICEYIYVETRGNDSRAEQGTSVRRRSAFLPDDCFGTALKLESRSYAWNSTAATVVSGSRKHRRTNISISSYI